MSNTSKKFARIVQEGETLITLWPGAPAEKTVSLEGLPVPDGWKIAESLEDAAEGDCGFAEQNPQHKLALERYAEQVKELWELTHGLKKYIEAQLKDDDTPRNTVRLETTTKVVNDKHLPEYENRQIAVLTITHETGTVETFRGQSNSVISAFNGWVEQGYTPV